MSASTALAATLGRQRRGALAVGGVVAARALSIAALSIPGIRGSRFTRGSISRAFMACKRLRRCSPDGRPVRAALVNLALPRTRCKQRSTERAFPKIRGPYTPPTAYQALSSPPPVALVTPPQAPLFATVAGRPPEVIPPVGGAPGGSFGPPVFAGIPSPGGGGGGGSFTPPIVTTVTPLAPVTLAAPVPEPASWGMTCLGFGLMGAAFRRRVAAGYRPARA